MSDQDPNPSQQEPAANGRVRAAEVAALQLALGQPVARAARKAQIGERTLFAWLKKPAFKRKVCELRGRLVQESIGRLSKDMAAASDVLRKLLKSKAEATRLKAATAIITLATKLRESEELEQRLADLEERLAGDKR